MIEDLAYYRPETLEEAFSALESGGPEVCVLAGGTHLIPSIKKGVRKSPKYMLDIKGIDDLRVLEHSGEGLRLGALATVEEIIRSPEVAKRIPLLKEAGSTMGTRQVRNRATIGGNICCASPASEIISALLALDARVVAAGPGAEEKIPLADFLAGPHKTALAPGRLLKEIYIPDPPAGGGWAFIKHTRSAVDISLVNAAVRVHTDPGSGLCREVRIVLGAVGPTALRAAGAEGELAGRPLSAENIGRAAEAAARQSRPVSDVRASAEYRRQLVGVLTGRALNRAKGVLAGV